MAERADGQLSLADGLPRGGGPGNAMLERIVWLTDWHPVVQLPPTIYPFGNASDMGGQIAPSPSRFIPRDWLNGIGVCRGVAYITERLTCV